MSDFDRGYARGFAEAISTLDRLAAMPKTDVLTDAHKLLALIAGGMRRFPSYELAQAGQLEAFMQREKVTH